MSELMKLRQDHATLARMFRQLERIIGEPQAPSQLELFELRRSLMQTLIGHLKLEDWALYPRLIDSGDEQISETGQHFKDEMGGLAPAFLGYCEKWTANTIAADWPAYCTDTRGLLDALNDRLTRENRELLPLLERLDEAVETPLSALA
jgi:iron-sulfur cluster repair protein YtfE (RIC family)